MHSECFDMIFFGSYRIRRYTDRNPEGATHTFGPTWCKLTLICFKEGPTM